MQVRQNPLKSQKISWLIMFLSPITVAKDQSGGRLDRLFGQLGAQQCPGGENAVKPQFFFAVMSKLSFKDAYDNL